MTKQGAKINSSDHQRKWPCVWGWRATPMIGASKLHKNRKVRVNLSFYN